MRRRREKVELTGDEEQIVSFRLGKSTFAVSVNQVREIGKVQDITKIPKMPDYIEGVMNLRGRIISLIDVKHFFGQQKTKLNGDSMIAVAEIGKTTIGFIFDTTDGVFYIDNNEIKPPLETIDPRMMRYTRGQLELNGRLCSLIGLKEIIEGDEVRAFVEEQSR